MVAVGNVHNTRILRFFLVLIAVILTIFIYASYSSTSTLTHMRTAVPKLAPLMNMEAVPPPLPHVWVENRSSEANLASDYNGTIQIKSQNSLEVKSKTLKSESATHRKSHRVPTIDVDALDDNGVGSVVDNSINTETVADEILERLSGANDLMEEQYVQNVDNLMGNINNNTNADAVSVIKQQQQQQQQQQLDSEILIPTSNLQKFIENADKLLKTMTNSSSSSSSTRSSTSTSTSTSSNSPVMPSVDAHASSVQSKNTASMANDKQTAQPAAPQTAAAGVNLKSQAIENNNEPLPPSVIMHIAGAASSVGDDTAAKSNVNAVKSSSSSPKSSTKLPIDPSKGIPTENIYEAGHLIEDENDFVNICPKQGADLKLLILITSAQTHKEARLSIRQTWGHFGQRRDVSTAFILGRTTNTTINRMLREENYIYGDLIRGNFIDSYNNLTLKTLSSLEWVDQYCPKVKYILKTDDDMFINVPKLINFLDAHKDKRVIYGRLAKKWKPIRNKKSKYYVSPDQFAATVFPAFTTGPAYVMTSDVVRDLYKRSLRTVYLKLEDVFTTGIVAQQLGIKRVHVNEFLNRRISFNPCNIRNAISVHMIKSNEQFDLWKKLLDQTTKCK